MAFLEIRSHVTTPSMKVIVASGSRSVIDCRMCATHSHPAFVDRACWKGAVIASTFLVIGVAMDLATNLLMMSPPRTPPSGLLRAVIRPNRMACAIASGTFPEARRELHSHNLRSRYHQHDMSQGTSGSSFSKVPTTRLLTAFSMSPAKMDKYCSGHKDSPCESSTAATVSKASQTTPIFKPP